MAESHADVQSVWIKMCGVSKDALPFRKSAPRLDELREPRFWPACACKLAYRTLGSAAGPVRTVFSLMR